MSKLEAGIARSLLQLVTARPGPRTVERPGFTALAEPVRLPSDLMKACLSGARCERDLAGAEQVCLYRRDVGVEGAIYDLLLALSRRTSIDQARDCLAAYMGQTDAARCDAADASALVASLIMREDAELDGLAVVSLATLQRESAEGGIPLSVSFA